MKFCCFWLGDAKDGCAQQHWSRMRQEGRHLSSTASAHSIISPSSHVPYLQSWMAGLKWQFWSSSWKSREPNCDRVLTLLHLCRTVRLFSHHCFVVVFYFSTRIRAWERLRGKQRVTTMLTPSTISSKYQWRRYTLLLLSIHRRHSSRRQRSRRVSKGAAPDGADTLVPTPAAAELTT